FSVEVTSHRADANPIALQALHDVVQPMDVEVVAFGALRVPAQDYTRRVQVVDDPRGRFVAQHPLDQPRQQAKVARCLAEGDQLHCTQSRSASRLHSSPALSEPFTLGASGCSDSGLAATVPSSRSASATISSGETSSST